MTSSNKGPLLSALYLKYDSQSRTVNKIKQNGYWSKTSEKNTKEISTHFSNTSTDNITQNDIIGLISKYTTILSHNVVIQNPLDAIILAGYSAATTWIIASLLDDLE